MDWVLPTLLILMLIWTIYMWHRLRIIERVIAIIAVISVLVATLSG